MVNAMASEWNVWTHLLSPIKILKKVIFILTGLQGLVTGERNDCNGPELDKTTLVQETTYV